MNTKGPFNVPDNQSVLIRMRDCYTRDRRVFIGGFNKLEFN